MKKKFNSLEELRIKKALLKNDIAEMEHLLTFENTKESLSAFTNGFTDQYLGRETTTDGETKTVLKTAEIVKDISNSVKDKVISKNAIFGFAKSDAGINVLENSVKIAAVTMLANYANKSMKNSSWKKKAIGFALIYIAPVALKMLSEKIDDWQRKRTTSSLEQLI